jgi:hypothetical protein
MMIKLPHLRGMYLWAKVGAVLCLGLLLAGCNRPPTPTPTPTPAAPTPTPAPTPKFPSTDPHVVRDKVIEFVRQKHPEVADLLGSPEWEGLPEPAVHAFAVFGYTSEKWRMDMTVLPAHLVAVDGVTLEEDTFDVELKYRSPPPYVIWTGEYAPDIDVQERHFVNREESRRAGGQGLGLRLQRGAALGSRPARPAVERATRQGRSLVIRILLHCRQLACLCDLE